MPGIPSLVLAASLLAPQLGNKPTPVDIEAVYDARSIAKAGTIAVPSGYGRYCSLSYASGGFAFDWGEGSSDPCATMLASSPGGKIARAGLWAKNGGNNVVARCEDGASVLLYALEGSAALQKAFENKAKKKCVFTVAPKQLPILGAPFALDDDAVSFVNGFDFARGFTVQTNAGSNSSKVNYKGVAVGYDGHDGMDWPMPKNRTIKAVQKGVVLVARARDIDKYLPGCPDGSTRWQNEVYVLHVIGTGAYAELFVSFYAHFDTMAVKAGDVVTKEQALRQGRLHRLLEHGAPPPRGRAHEQHRDDVPPAPPRAGDPYDQTTMIDPYGFSWSAKAASTVGAWRAIGQSKGALSINLWAWGSDR